MAVGARGCEELRLEGAESLETRPHFQVMPLAWVPLGKHSS